jgi:hypothetical protein
MLNKPQLLFTRPKPARWKCDVCEELFLLSSEKLTLQEKAWDLDCRFENHVRANHSAENRVFTTKINSPNQVMREIERQSSLRAAESPNAMPRAFSRCSARPTKLTSLIG